MKRRSDTLIREANYADVLMLTTLSQRTFEQSYGQDMAASDLAAHLKTYLSLERIREALDEDTFLLAVIDQGTVGFVQYGNVDIPDEYLSVSAAKDDLEIRRLYVLAEFQNHGVGTRLMNAALIDSWAQVADHIYLDVWQDNYGAQRFYRRLGFQRVGERPFVLASGQPVGVDYIMMKCSASNSC